MSIWQVVVLVVASLVLFYLILWLCAYGLSIWAEQEQRKRGDLEVRRPSWPGIAARQHNVRDEKEDSLR